MFLTRVKKTMTSFKLSDATRAQMARIRDTRNSKFSEFILGQRLTNTDVIRQLIAEECKRLDDASETATAERKDKKKPAAKKSNKANPTKKGK